jgi:hypothetical protein
MKEHKCPDPDGGEIYHEHGAWHFDDGEYRHQIKFCPWCGLWLNYEFDE